VTARWDNRLVDIRSVAGQVSSGPLRIKYTYRCACIGRSRNLLYSHMFLSNFPTYPKLNRWKVSTANGK